MELHKNGKIWAESEGEGFGCTFFVHLPLHSHQYVPPSDDSSSRNSMREMMMTSTLPTTVGPFDDSIRTTPYQANASNGEPQRNGSLATTKTAMDVDEDVSMSMSSSSSNKDGSNVGTLSGSSKGQGRRLTPVPPLAPKLAAAVAWKPTILVVDDSAMNRKVHTCSLHAYYCILLCHPLSQKTHPLSHDSSPSSFLPPLVRCWFAC